MLWVFVPTANEVLVIRRGIRADGGGGMMMEKREDVIGDGKTE